MCGCTLLLTTWIPAEPSVGGQCQQLLGISKDNSDGLDPVQAKPAREKGESVCIHGNHYHVAPIIESFAEPLQQGKIYDFLTTSTVGYGAPSVVCRNGNYFKVCYSLC